MTARVELAPITNELMLTNRRTGRSECWQAETEEGVWCFVREESPGTPWLIVHRASGKVQMMAGSLRKCRLYVAEGIVPLPEAEVA